MTGLAHSVILLGYAFIFTPAPLAQPRIDLSSAQAQLSAAVDNLDANAARDAVRAGADPNYRYGPRGHSVLGTVGLNARGLPVQVPLPGLMERVSTETETRIIAIYEALFELGARLQSYDRGILLTPAYLGAPRVTKYLLERGANPNGANDDGDTPTILATEYGHQEIVSVLRAGGATPLDSATEAQVRMIAAAQRGDSVTLRRELTRGADVNRKSPTGKSALVATIRGGVFIRGGNLIMLRELLKQGANPNLSGRFIGESSPLHAAVLRNEKAFESDNGPAIVDALLKAGAHVSSTVFHRKQTPLHVAAHLQNTRAAMLLLKAGAKVMPRDEDGKTPLDFAESSAMIDLLRAHGAKEQ